MSYVDIVFSISVLEFFMWVLFFGWVWNSLFGELTDIGSR